MSGILNLLTFRHTEISTNTVHIIIQASVHKTKKKTRYRSMNLITFCSTQIYYLLCKNCYIGTCTAKSLLFMRNLFSWFSWIGQSMNLGSNKNFIYCKIILYHIYILQSTYLRNPKNVLCDKTTKFHAHEIKWIHIISHSAITSIYNTYQRHGYFMNHHIGMWKHSRSWSLYFIHI
jgi:hypothetical protein